MDPSETIDGGDRFAGDVDGVGTFYIEEGRRIIIDPVDGVEDGILRTILLGPVLSVLLRQRGLLVLHASCVIIDGLAVAFIGASGAGKSTTAEAFYAAGHRVLTDDVTAIDSASGTHHVIPGYPQIKLMPDAAASLVDDGADLPLLFGHALKHTHRIDQDFPTAPVPLAKIYVLDRGDDHGIEPLPKQDIFPVVLCNSRGVTLLRTPSYSAAHLATCTQLLTQVPTARLHRRFGLDALPDLVALVEEDIRAHAPSLAS